MELALIDERDPNAFTDADWEQARQELLGATVPAPPEETKQNADLQDEWEVVANDSGHRVPRSGEDDEQSLGQQLVAGGVEEATHDQMLEARREELEQDLGVLARGDGEGLVKSETGRFATRTLALITRNVPWMSG